MELQAKVSGAQKSGRTAESQGFRVFLWFLVR
jgi:hypothetical protein